MISLKINDINNFMQKLLIGNAFDTFLLCEGEVDTSNTFSINGRINQKFYNADELEAIPDEFVYWRDIKHIFFEMIKGHKVPSKMKLVFALSKTKYSDILMKSQMAISESEIGGLYIHVMFEDNSPHIITGTSINTFTMDKTLDKYWDKTISNFLSEHFNCDLL